MVTNGIMKLLGFFLFITLALKPIAHASRRSGGLELPGRVGAESWAESCLVPQINDSG